MHGWANRNGPGWTLAGKLRAALAHAVLDDRDAVTTVVVAEQLLKHIGGRIGAHDCEYGPRDVSYAKQTVGLIGLSVAALPITKLGASADRYSNESCLLG